MCYFIQASQFTTIYIYTPEVFINWMFTIIDRIFQAVTEKPKGCPSFLHNKEWSAVNYNCATPVQLVVIAYRLISDLSA